VDLHWGKGAALWARNQPRFLLRGKGRAGARGSGRRRTCTFQREVSVSFQPLLPSHVHARTIPSSWPVKTAPPCSAVTDRPPVRSIQPRIRSIHAPAGARRIYIARHILRGAATGRPQDPIVLELTWSAGCDETCTNRTAATARATLMRAVAYARRLRRGHRTFTTTAQRTGLGHARGVHGSPGAILKQSREKKKEKEKGNKGFQETL